MTSGFATFGFDSVRKLLTFKHHDGTAVQTSNFRTDSEIKDLVPLTEATNSGISLVSNAANRQLVRLNAGQNIVTGVGGTVVLPSSPLLLDTITNPTLERKTLWGKKTLQWMVFLDRK